MAENQETPNIEAELINLRQRVAGLETKNKQLEELVRIDPLTGLGNKRHFYEELEIAIETAKREKRPISVIFVDLDNFKNLNDQEGHLAGDQTLKHVATLIASGLRKTDRPCRFGGEEVAIILPNTPANRATGVAERLRNSIEVSPIDLKDKAIKVTASMGVGSFNPNLTEQPKDIAAFLVDTADKLMYAAKRAGKNRVGFIDNNGKPRILEQSNLKPSGKVATFPNS